MNWDVERMRPVVREWDEALRAELPAYARLVPEAEARGSVLLEPASEEAIAAAEQRLGVALPPSYRSSLLLSDGADASVFGASKVVRLQGADGGGLLRVADVVPLSESVPFLVPQWLDAMGEFADQQEEPSLDASVDVFDFAPGEDALLITVPEQHEIVALVPFDGEWQVWEFGASEVHAHESFAAFLRHKTRASRARVTERAARVKAAIADGSHSPISRTSPHTVIRERFRRRAAGSSAPPAAKPRSNSSSSAIQPRSRPCAPRSSDAASKTRSRRLSRRSSPLSSSSCSRRLTAAATPTSKQSSDEPSPTGPRTSPT